MATKYKVKKNDQVIVISGKDRGKRGRVIEVLRNEGKVMVEGIGLIKKHVRPNRQRGIAGGIVEQERPIDVSNVMVVDPDGKKPTRLGVQVLSDGRKVRVSRKTGSVLE